MKSIPSSRPRSGFTLIELLTVIAIIGILAAILIPTVSRMRETGKRAKCLSNVRQITVSLINSANQNKGGFFPTNTHGGAWAWDVSHAIAREVVSNAGREAFYCPSSNMLQLYDLERQLWQFGGSLNSFAVTNYVLLVPGTGQINALYLNDKIRDFYKVNNTEIPASRRILVHDAVISDSASLSSFAQVNGGLPNNLSNHMEGAMAAGGHAGYIDGHVKWRKFVQASLANPDGFEPRNTGTSPRFWF